MNNRALVTGGGGFIGFHTAKYLADKGLEVTIIDNMSRGKFDDMFASLVDKSNVKFIEADMTNRDFYDKLEGRYEYIYHLAAINGTKYFYEKSYEVLRVNILSLINILEWCNRDNCGSFLFTSSSEAYASTVNKFLHTNPDYVPTKEDIELSVDDVLNSRWSYGGSKITGELLTINYCRTIQIPFKIVRYHNIYGERMGFEHVIPEFVKRIYDKENPFKILGGEETRAFCYIKDAVLATEAVMLSENCNGEIVHIGNSTEEIKISELLNKLLRISNLDTKIKKLPAPKGCVSRRCPNTDKLYSLTRYKASTSLNEGLKVTFDWYMNEYNK